MGQDLSAADRRDLILSGILLVPSVLVFILATRMPPSPLEPLGPGSLPMALSIGLGAMGILQILRVLRSRKSAPSDPSAASAARQQPAEEEPGAAVVPRPGLAVGAVAGLIAMTALIHARVLTFRPVAFVYVLFLAFFLHRREGKFSSKGFWIAAIIVSAAMSFGVHWMFTTIFNVRLR